MNIFLFSTVTLLYASVFFVLCWRKLYRSSLFIWFLGLSIGVVFPYLYSAAGGSDYRVYSQEAFLQYTYIVIGYLVAFVFVFFSVLRYLPIDFFWERRYLDSSFFKLVFWVVGLIVALYVFYYKDSLPLFLLARGESFVRPDVYASELSYFFSFYTLVIFFAPLLYINSFSKRSPYSLIFLAAVFLLLIIGGNKGLLLFFLIFLYLYCSSRSSRMILILCFFVLLFLYVAFMVGVSGISFNNIAYIIESPVKRFFIVQGMGLPARIEMMISGELDSSMSASEISANVYRFVYGAEGAMPTFFLGDLFVYFGTFGSLVIGFILTGIFLVLGILVDKSRSYLYLWIYYLVSYAILMSGFSYETILRTGFILVFLFSVWFLREICSSNSKKAM